MTCKNLCDQTKVTQGNIKKIYKNGGKYCIQCQAGFMTDKLFCPCCCRRLRTKARYRPERLLRLIEMQKERRIARDI